jgi:hypothetical protein
MSDLDDAIRDHLELKRLRGADPREVARLEREALGTVTRVAEPFAPEQEVQVHRLSEPAPSRETQPQRPGTSHAGEPIDEGTAWRPHVDGGEETQELSVAHAPRWAAGSADHATG